MVTLASAVNTNPSRTLTFGNDNGTLRDASFSAYLNGAEETFVRKLADSSRNLMPFIMATTHGDQQADVERKKEDDEEIGVFGAEKYFKGGLMDEDNPRTASMISAKKLQYKKAERVHLDSMKYISQPRSTPSVQSESSWNSQSALLQNVLRNPSRTNTNKVRRKTILAVLGCKYCSCSDKESVEIKEHGDEMVSFQGQREPRKTDDLAKLDRLGVGLNRENCFTFPTSNSEAGSTLPIKLQYQEEKDPEKLRKSIEVFGSPVMENRNKSLGVERRLTMLSWDVTPRLEELEFSAPSGGAYNDTESDASSDLFEIESLTGKANPFLARQASDGATSGCVTPTTCYEPSEASIEWSVVTASAADFSVMSDCEELRQTSTRKAGSAIPNAKAETNKEIQRRRSGILLGCKSQKAVQVAGDAYRTNEKANVYPPMYRRSDSIIPVTRFRAETMSTGFSSRQGKRDLAIRPPHRSQSPRASHLLYIQ
jgi:hypothetical protein